MSALPSKAVPRAEVATSYDNPACDRSGTAYCAEPAQPGYDQQKSFDDALVKLDLFDFSEYGPPADVFLATLGGAGYTVSGLNLERMR